MAPPGTRVLVHEKRLYAAPEQPTPSTAGTSALSLPLLQSFDTFSWFPFKVAILKISSTDAAYATSAAARELIHALINSPPAFPVATNDFLLSTTLPTSTPHKPLYTFRR
jgi:hypothetical protein